MDTELVKAKMLLSEMEQKEKKQKSLKSARKRLFLGAFGGALFLSLTIAQMTKASWADAFMLAFGVMILFYMVINYVDMKFKETNKNLLNPSQDK